ncbi:unnamed protein product [Lasius platythorax]|uniref:Uncharacterized protein n=1 Tax=Lasius platythorax TaxID=488582 RepID=A0AAV2NVQ2_9HYME
MPIVFCRRQVTSHPYTRWRHIRAKTKSDEVFAGRRSLPVTSQHDSDRAVLRNDFSRERQCATKSGGRTTKEYSS